MGMSDVPDGDHSGPDDVQHPDLKQYLDRLQHLGDRELWHRAADGEGECFGLIFDRHAEKVRAYCARRTGSLDAADDLVSIVFLEAWRRRVAVEIVADSALPWLYGVARNVVLRRHRSARRHRAALSRLPTEHASPDHADEVAARLDDQQELDRLRAAFTTLRRRDQEVLTLCVWQSLDYASAAVALGIPVGTVRSRLSRARARLRDLATPADTKDEHLAATRPFTPRQEIS